MSEWMSQVMDPVARSHERTVGMVERLMETARPDAVFGAATTSGEYTAIPASENVVGLGYGFGLGAGSGDEEEKEEKPGDGVAGAEGGRGETPSGGGGGGGGYAGSRPVAVITIGPRGVQVEPVVDVTKIALAFFTMVGAYLLMLGRMGRAMRAG